MSVLTMQGDCRGSVYSLRRAVAKLLPGQRLNVDRHTLEFLGPRVPRWVLSGPATWPVPDQVLTGIVGSGKQFGYSVHWRGEHVTFWRLEKPLEGDCWTYIDPDRRDGWIKGPDDIWRRSA